MNTCVAAIEDTYASFTFATSCGENAGYCDGGSALLGWVNKQVEMLFIVRLSKEPR
jgi:hypothetical protein